jgi:ParB family chromosome partitioning protein
MGGQAFDTRRISTFLFDPDDLIIVGLDTNDGPEHPLYDEGRLKEKVPDSMVKNIMRFGVIESISITKVGDKPVVVDGRRRVRAAREAAKRQRAQGEETVKVPCLVKRGDDEELMGILISGNEHRLDDGPIARAMKAQRLKDRGRNLAEIGVYFGVSSTAISNWLAVLDCIAEVKRAVEKGIISMSAAVELSGLSPEEQKAALAKMVAEGKTTVADAKNKKKASRGESTTRAPRKTLVKKVIEAEDAENVLGKDFIRGVLWTIGEMEPRQVKGLTALIDEVS